VRRLIALFLAAAVWHLSSPAAAAAPEAKRLRPTGDLFTSGRVLIDGTDAVGGTSFFSGSEVSTEEGSRAVLGLGRSGRAELLPRSSLVLDFGDDGVSGSLGAGGVRISKPDGVSATVATGDGSVAAGPAGPAVFTVRYDEGRTSLETQAGEVRLRLKGREMTVAAGERYAEGQDAPSAANGLTGKKKAGIFLAIGGVVALIAIILTGTHNDNDVILNPSNPIVPSPR
jgi:ferric-dicitrate binding protein FerR (iron transport regulator)